MVSLAVSAVRVLQVTSMVRALRVMSWMAPMLVGVLQVVCRLVAPLVLPVCRVLLGMLWAVVLSVMPMVRVTQAMHRVTVRPVCAVGDALRTGGEEPERVLPLVQRAMVALVISLVRLPQVMDRVMVLLVMPMAGEVFRVTGVGEADGAGGVACGATGDGMGTPVGPMVRVL